MKSKKRLIILGASILGAGLISLLLLNTVFSKPASVAAENTVITVQRGNLSTDITAGGNLALSVKEDVAFKVSGFVEEVLVSEGESVKEGQVIARLDTTPLELSLLKAEDAYAKAERALEDAKVPYSEVDKAVAEASLAAADSKLSGAYNSWANDQSSASKWSAVKSAEADLAKARDTWAKIQAGPDPRDITSAELQLKMAQATLDDASAQLKEATLVAPFAGFVSQVIVKGGDEVKKGTIAIQLTDPNKFEAEIMVNENNIFRMKLGDTASVKVDALPATSLSAKVTYIDPTATIQSGVVNYKVKVEVAPLQPVTAGLSGPGSGAIEGSDAAQGQSPSATFVRPQGAGTAAQGQTGQQRLATGTTRQTGSASDATPANVQLREGLTITVSIIVDQRNNVLLVPNTAITSRSGKTYVQVQNGVVAEERLITTGISNWQFTEVISGLSEGDKVVVARSAAPTQPSTTQGTSQQQRNQPVRIPGIGSIR